MIHQPPGAPGGQLRQFEALNCPAVHMPSAAPLHLAHTYAHSHC